MKFLTVLSVLQIAVITALLLKVYALDKNLTALMLAQSGAVDTGLVDLPVASSNTVANQAAEQAQLRTILREEIAAALLSFSPKAVSQQSSVVASAASGGDQKTEDYQNELEVLEAELDYYITRGAISDREMSALQMQMARLDQSGRKQIMRKLVRSLNSGELSGRL